MNGKTLILSGGTYHYPDCFNRMEEYSHYLSDGKRSDFKTQLFYRTTPITVVKESIEEIMEMLKNG